MKFYLNVSEGFKNFASSTNHAHISFIYLIYLFRSPILSIYLPASPPFPPPQQPRLSNFASFPTVRQALESIKYWIVVITISSISIILFLYSNQIFFLFEDISEPYIRITQNMFLEMQRLWSIYQIRIYKCFLYCCVFLVFVSFFIYILQF